MIEIQNNGHSYRIGQPLCGWDWLREHLHDHRHAEIEALSIEIGYNDRWMHSVSSADNRGTVKTIVRGLR